MIESIKSFNPDGNYKLLTNGVDISQYSLPEYSYRNDILFAGKLFANTFGDPEQLGLGGKHP